MRLNAIINDNSDVINKEYVTEVIQDLDSTTIKSLKTQLEEAGWEDIQSSGNTSGEIENI